VLKLRKVELLGFKSFCEKTPITFSGTGITCIVGPNGCGKSNVVDAISWVLGEQSHKMLRAERMSDCIFNGTAKRPPMGLSEVTLTLVDPELTDAVAKVLQSPEETADSAEVAGPVIVEQKPLSGDVEATVVDGLIELSVKEVPEDENDGPDGAEQQTKSKKKRGSEKPAMQLKPGEVVVGRRLYRSGQSEYLINGRVARLRDVQEIFMGMGLGPDSYAIIEQGRIGQILNSKPMDRRAIIEEAAGITMYKTKRRLAEAKLEASKANLSRIHDILVEVEKQLASLKRQASKARRYAELREQMRELLRNVLASKAEHLDIEAARLENLLREMATVEEREATSVHELEVEQERLSSRSYELDGELRQIQNLLGQTALDLDRAENRITFNREQAAQIEAHALRLTVETEAAERQVSDLSTHIAAYHEAAVALHAQADALETSLREIIEQSSLATSEQAQLEARMSELQQVAGQLVEESAREHAESLQAEQAAARYTAAEGQRESEMQVIGHECTALAEKVSAADQALVQARTSAQELGETVRNAQTRLAELRRNQQTVSQTLERTREELSAERARHVSIEQILSERAYTADAVQKLFNVAHEHGANAGSGFHAVGLLADYTEVQEQYEAAIEQFLHDELEYIVVESFDHARAGIALLRNEMGGRATFFVDSLNKLNLHSPEAGGPLPTPTGVLERLDRLVDFREPLGPAAKSFLTKLRAAYLVETATLAEKIANENPHNYFLTPDGTCYHGRMVSGGRAGQAGPLALKRELRQHESEALRLEQAASEQQAQMTSLEEAIAEGEEQVTTALAGQMEAEKSLVAATHQRDQARFDLQRLEQQFATERQEILRLHAEAESARNRALTARSRHTEAMQAREAAESESTESSARLSRLRQDFQTLQEQAATRREELAAISERLTGAEGAERRVAEEMTLANERMNTIRQQHEVMLREKSELQTSCEQLGLQVQELRKEKARLDELKSVLESEWELARTRSTQLEDTVRGKRLSLEELRAERSRHQIEKARNDTDRDYLRQTCISELNAQPEELMAQQAEQLLLGEALIAAETNYNEMKARVEAMGPVNMMALEEFKECEERDAFMRRERDDLVASIQNTQLTIMELDQVSRQKFEEAFNFINAHFAIAFQSLFGGGHGEMRLAEPDSSGEAGIDIVAQPPGKRLQNILLLSGGEKALTALALLIAVFKYQPSPFCILDEVDAPLDEANVGRFNKMLADMCGQTQFIVVTHNRKTMEMGSVLYGVTMQEPGVSKLVSVKWEDTAVMPASKAATNAA
jgi:chromosome segregation protein